MKYSFQDIINRFFRRCDHPGEPDRHPVWYESTEYGHPPDYWCPGSGKKETTMPGYSSHPSFDKTSVLEKSRALARHLKGGDPDARRLDELFPGPHSNAADYAEWREAFRKAYGIF